MSGRILMPLTRLCCHDGIAGHLATLLPLLKAKGWRISMVAGHCDCQTNSQSVLGRIQTACDEFDVDPRLFSQGKNCVRGWLDQSISLRQWLKFSRADVVHLQGRALGPLALFVGGGVKRVYTRQLALTATSGATLLPGVRLKWPRFWCDRAIGISLKTCTELRVVERMPASMVRYVPHGVDLARFRPPTEVERRESRSKLGLDEKTFVCLQLGRVTGVKRPETLARAVVRLRDEGRGVVALFAGEVDPETERYLRSSVPNGGDGWLRLLGHADPRPALWAADVKILASEREGFATAVVEAMACGIVPLRTPTDGAEDQITEGVDGFLFGLGDDAKLSHQIASLMDDPHLRQRMGVAARAKSQRFAASAMAEKIDSIYGELVNGLPPDARCACPV